MLFTQVITGLLRRADEVFTSGISVLKLLVILQITKLSKCALFYPQEIFSKTPIGFIPLGSSNSLSQSLHLVSDNKVQ